jgi:hypothetical protein
MHASQFHETNEGANGPAAELLIALDLELRSNSVFLSCRDELPIRLSDLNSAAPHTDPPSLSYEVTQD